MSATTKPATKKRGKTPAAKKAPVKRGKKGLSVRLERFAEFIAAGDVPADGWIKAGHNVTRNVAKSAANRALLTNVALQERIAQLRKPQTKAALRTKDDNLRFLAMVIGTPIDQIDASSILCTEYIEEVVAGGSRGKLKRGTAASGNETVEPMIVRRRIKKSDPLRAIEIYSRLRGHFEPDRVEIEAGPNTLQTIKERADQVRGELRRRYGCI